MSTEPVTIFIANIVMALLPFIIPLYIWDKVAQWRKARKARKAKSVVIPLAPGVTLTSRSNGHHSPVMQFAGYAVADVLTLTSLLKRIDAADIDRIHYLIDQHMVDQDGKMVFADATDEMLFICGRKAVVS